MYSEQQLKDIELSAEREALGSSFNFTDNTPRYIGEDWNERIEKYVEENEVAAVAAFVRGLKKAQEKKQVRIVKEVPKNLREPSLHEGRFTWYIRAFMKILAMNEFRPKEKEMLEAKKRALEWLSLGFSTESETSFKTAIGMGQIDVAMKINPPITEKEKLSQILEGSLVAGRRGGSCSPASPAEFYEWLMANKKNLVVSVKVLKNIIENDLSILYGHQDVVFSTLLKKWCSAGSKKILSDAKVKEAQDLLIISSTNRNEVSSSRLENILLAFTENLSNESIDKIFDIKNSDTLPASMYVPQEFNNIFTSWSMWSLMNLQNTSSVLFEKYYKDKLSVVEIKSILKVWEEKYTIIQDEAADSIKDDFFAFRSGVHNRLLTDSVSDLVEKPKKENKNIAL